MEASIEFKKGEIVVNYRIGINTESDGTMSCVIAPFNIGFIARTQEEMNKKADFFIKSFFDYRTFKSGKLSQLLLTLRKLGFKTPNQDLVLYQVFKSESLAEKQKFVLDTVADSNYSEYFNRESLLAS